MKITPIDIAHKNFGKKMMGFDTQEVIEFLQHISSQMEALIHERNHLKEVLREKELSLLEYKERDKLLKDTIATASQMSEKIRQESEREAKFIIAEAQQKAEFITRDAKDSLKKSYQEVVDLKRTRLQFEANLKALVQAHLSILEQGEKYMPSVNYTIEQQNKNHNAAI
jgi:cell division initiation protein